MLITKLDLQEPSVSSIFLNQITIVDHAYIDERGYVIGGSFNPSFIVEGTPDPVEKVVVDFSAIKKNIKQIIDQHVDDVEQNGFDHKLWIIPGLSLCEYEIKDGQIEISTPVLSMTSAIDAVKIVNIPHTNIPVKYSMDGIGDAMGTFVEKKLREQFPKVGIRVQCVNSTAPHHTHNGTQAAMFRYVHGLRDSTSYGCKNIGHGHLSFISVVPDEKSTNMLHLQLRIAQDLDETIFVRNDNVRSITPTHITFGYDCARGKFSMTVDHTQQRVTVLNTETTIEFLANYVMDRYSKELYESGARSFQISEGLSKGTVQRVQR